MHYRTLTYILIALTKLVPIAHTYSANPPLLTDESFALKDFTMPIKIRSAFNQVCSNDLTPLGEISNRVDFMEKVKQGTCAACHLQRNRETLTDFVI